MSDNQTKFPIVFVHGIGFRDQKIVNYWGRIPAHLEKNGAQIFYGGQDSWGSISDNAEKLHERILSILKETGAEKVHIIAHSKGGIDARAMVSKYEMGDCVASVSTISSPHHGSRTMDFVTKFPSWMISFVGFLVDFWFRILGDKHPKFAATVHSLTTKQMAEFNRQHPDVEGVYYQSFGFQMRSMSSDFFLWFPYLIVKLFDGDNDGIVSVESSKWTNYSGPIKREKRRGISHLDEVDFRRRGFRKSKKVESDFDILRFYQNLVSRLTELEETRS